MADNEQTRTLLGRERIYNDVELTSENVVGVINQLLTYHIRNSLDEDYLYRYRKGRQPILNRTKEVRPEICNKIVVNNAEEVCAFKNGYFLTRPAFYVGLKNSVSNKVKKYNEYVRLSGKNTADNKLADWFHTVGIATLYVESTGNDKVPFKCYALDPRYSFVAYDLTPGENATVGVNIVLKGENKSIIDVFTKDKYFKLSGEWGGSVEISKMLISVTANSVIEEKKNQLGLIPIIEYTYNSTRTGAFEQALPILDAINLVESNRADAIEQQVQQLCVAYNCQFEEGTTANSIREAGMITLVSTDGQAKADFKILETINDQTGTQVTLNNLYEQMLKKCAMPSTNKGGTSTSDTGTAVYLRDGWAQADCSARNTTDLFMESNALFDEIALKILAMQSNFKLDPETFELKIERNSTSNLVAKTQAALNMKSLGLAPEIWLERSGLSNDPLADIELSKDYLYADQKVKEEKVEKVVEEGVTNEDI